MRERWMKKHFENVDCFTTPSTFMLERYAQWGLPSRKLRHVANGLGPRLSSDTGLSCETAVISRRNRFGFFGQIVDNKGLLVILDAVEMLRREGFVDFVIEINGDNLEFASEDFQHRFQDFIEAENQRSNETRNVVLNGSYQIDELGIRMERIDWCIVPSVWAEAYCLVIDESWRFGKPVIASNCGAIAERVRHGVDGLLFGRGNAHELARTIRKCHSEPDLWQKLVSGIESPDGNGRMIEDFIELYRSPMPTEERS